MKRSNFIGLQEAVLKNINKTFSALYYYLNAIYTSIQLKNQIYYSSLKPFLKILSHLLKNVLFLIFTLYRYQLSTCFQSYNNSTHIGRKTHKNMTAYLLYSLKPQLTKFMHILKHIKYSLYDSSTFINPLKGFIRTNCSYHLLNIYILLNIKSRTIFTFPKTPLSKKTTLSFLFKKSATKFNSSSFIFPSPVTKLHTTRTQKFSLLCNLYQSCKGRFFSTSWIFCSVGCYIMLKKIFSVFQAIITSIGYYCLYSLSCLFNFFVGTLCKFLKIMSIPLVCLSNFNRDSNRERCCGGLKMNFVSIKAKIFRLVSPLRLFIRGKGFYMRGVNKEFKVFCFSQDTWLGQ